MKGGGGSGYFIFGAKLLSGVTLYNIIKITHFIYTFSLPPPSKDFKYLSHCHWSHSQENHMPLFVLVTLKTTQKINKTKL